MDHDTFCDEEAMETVRRTLETCELKVPETRPWLLLDGTGREVIRQRAAERDGLLECVRKQCEERVAGGVVPVTVYDAGPAVSEVVAASEGYFLLGDRSLADWALGQAREFFKLESWMCPLHGKDGPDAHADHVMCNIAAALVYAHDLLGDACTEEDMSVLAEVVNRLCVEKFIYTTHDRKSWWSYEEWKTNWKIMCCGETGFAVCGLADRLPDVRQALWLSARGVIETLNAVPPEGDWEEGVTYWFTTLYMGLRFAVALKRLTSGDVDLLEHPALARTGDFGMMTAFPSGYLYDFNDNLNKMTTVGADAMLWLAVHAGRRDWLHAVRMFPSDTPVWLSNDAPDLEDELPSKLTANFPDSGVATMRSGWGPSDVFVGIKSSRSDVSHGHLDANSFVLSAAGVPLVVDSGTWPYAAHISSFDFSGPRWNFDGFATIGHSTLMVDGQGQASGKDLVGRIIEVSSGEGWHKVVGDASGVYPGLLETFVRTIILLGSELVIIRDVIRCAGERHVEWLLHYAGDVRTVGVSSVVENEEVRLVVTPLLPDRSNGWRISDVTRTSVYEGQDFRKDVTPSIHYRSFSPFRAAGEFEFLFGMRVGGAEDGGDWTFALGDDGWELRAEGAVGAIRPDGRSLAYSTA